MSALAALRDSAACTYCRTPTRLPADADGAVFCCNGCRTASALINQAGLAKGFTSLLGEARPTPPRDAERSYAAFDDPAYLTQHSRSRPDGQVEVDLVVEGIHCAACLWLLEKLPRLCAGVSAARLDVGQARLTTVFDPERTQLSAVADTLARLGYPAYPARDASRVELRRRQDRLMLMRMGVAFAVAANVMLMAAALYCGDRFGIQQDVRSFLRWASMVVTLPSLFFSAAPFFRGALAALRTRTAHIDLALAVSLGAGFAQGIANTIRASGEIYFDSVTALVFALLASRYVHQRKQRQAADATELLAALTPSVAHRLHADGTVVDIASASVQVGDVIEVHAGEAIPVDGEVRSGEGCVDRALLTGESEPVDVRAGDAVHAGTVCVGTNLVVTATATGGETRLAALTRRMEMAGRNRAEIIELADRFGGYFVAGALFLAVVTLAVTWRLGFDVAIDRAIALLIVACPCALGLATPLAMSSAMASAARQRILIRTSAALERLTQVETVIFDKTGTLTEGRLSLARWFGDRSVRGMVAALESHIDHPVARALRSEDTTTEHEVARMKHLGGHGVSGYVDGVHLIVGAPHWVAANAANGEEWVRMAGDLAEQGFTPVLVAREHEVVALAGLADQLRGDARSTIAALKARGLDVRLVSGDDPRVVARVARQLGIERFEALASPERKLEVVHELERVTVVAMVGDGVNDAAALAAATVGVAVHGGAEASMAAADVYIARPNLDAIVDAFAGAGRAATVVRTGIAFGLVYNVIGVCLAMSGAVTPLLAAVLMPTASLTVVTLAHTMRTFGGRR